MPNNLYAHVVLDRSGSMESCRDSTIGAVNEYVNTLRAGGASARLSLTLFDDIGIDLIHDNVRVEDVPPVTAETFVPRGMTPLNDAIGKTVVRIDAEPRREGERVALVILTDGLENASKEHTKESVRKLLESRQKEKGWLVLYLGANQDAWAEGAARGVKGATSMDFDMGRVAPAMTAAGRATMAYAAGAPPSAVEFTAQEREASRKR